MNCKQAGTACSYFHSPTDTPSNQALNAVNTFGFWLHKSTFASILYGLLSELMCQACAAHHVYTAQSFTEPESIEKVENSSRGKSKMSTIPSNKNWSDFVTTGAYKLLLLSCTALVWAMWVTTLQFAESMQYIAYALCRPCIPGSRFWLTNTIVYSFSEDTCMFTMAMASRYQNNWPGMACIVSIYIHEGTSVFAI